ncbi:hypothetical protein JCM39194_25440 [Desulfotomaculum varum]
MPLGIYSYYTRNKFEEYIKRQEKKKKTLSKSDIGSQIIKYLQKIGYRVDEQKLDNILYLAGRPFDFTAEEIIFSGFVLAGVIFVSMTAAVTLGILPLPIAITMALAGIVVPLIKIRGDALEGKTRLGLECANFCMYLELVLSAGLTEQRALEFAANSQKGLLGPLIKRYTRETGSYPYVVFSRIYDDFSIEEARDMAMVLKQANIQGTEVSKALATLAQNFKEARINSIDAQILQAKPVISMYLTLATIVAAILLMTAPIAVENLKNFTAVLGG